MGFPSPNALVSQPSLPVGAAMTFASYAPLIQLEDGSQWLRSGTAIGVGRFPKADKIESLQLFGQGAPTTNPTLSGRTGCATDGNGNFVVVSGSGLFVSTDYGNTWTSYSHNLTGGTPCSVAYGNGNWVIVGNTASTIYTAYKTGSPAGNFTTGSTIAGATLTADTAAVKYTGGTSFAIVATGSVATNSAAYSSNSGVTFTGKTPSAVLGSGVTGFCIVADGAGKVMAANNVNGTANIGYSADYGNTWSSTTLPAGLSGGVVSGAEYLFGKFWFNTAGNRLYFSTDGSTIPATNYTVIPLNSGCVAPTGYGFLTINLQICSGDLAFAVADATNNIRGILLYDGRDFWLRSFYSHYNFNTNSTSFCVDNNGRIAMPGSAASYGMYGSIISPTAVGTRMEAITGSSNTHLSVYHKVA